MNTLFEYTVIMLEKDSIHKKAWVVAADMGYGHQRTAHPLMGIAFGRKIINANNYQGITVKDRNFWQMTKSSYEFIARFRRIPFIGEKIYLFFDSFQKILGYYPQRDLSKSNFGGRIIYYFIKRGWGKNLVARLQRTPLPLITTFFPPAFMAEEFGYLNQVYCVICDADIARAWVALDPKKSRIKYFAPCTWARDRLKLYGVKPENIILTGYPLPKENLGGENLQTLKKDLSYRLLNLDPNGRYRRLYAPLIKGYFGELPKISNHPLTILFSIGGAGAQKEIGVKIVNKLAGKIRAEKLRVIISVGMREELRKYFADHIKNLKLDGWVHMLSGKTVTEYFEKFNQALRTTDLLWTKPSELSFYAALGIPIILAPSMGSQEDFNRKWLLHVGAAVPEEDLNYVDEWLYDLLLAGDFAEMAMQGFIEMEKLGTYNIEREVAKINHA